MVDRQTIGINVPQEWVEEADDSDVSRSEWFRRLVRAGRRQWGYDHVEEPDEPGMNLDEPSSDNDSIDDLEAAILRNLSTSEGVDQEELAELLLDDLQEQMETALQSLKDDGKVDIDLTKGGWVKTE